MDVLGDRFDEPHLGLDPLEAKPPIRLRSSWA